MTQFTRSRLNRSGFKLHACTIIHIKCTEWPNTNISIKNMKNNEQ